MPAPTETIIPCGVPYWDERNFFTAGGLYSKTDGHHILESAYLADFDKWLPRKWQYRGDPPGPVLLPDMLPTTSWEANLRTRLTEQEWGRLRKFCYQAAGHTCIACGSRGEPHVEAHEAWSFNDETGVQKLTGLLCLCPTCHKAKHLGYAQRLGLLDKVYAKLRWLNDWTDADLEAALYAAETRHKKLSSREWTLDLSFLFNYGVR